MHLVCTLTKCFFPRNLFVALTHCKEIQHQLTLYNTILRSYEGQSSCKEMDIKKLVGFILAFQSELSPLYIKGLIYYVPRQRQVDLFLRYWFCETRTSSYQNIFRCLSIWLTQSHSELIGKTFRNEVIFTSTCAALYFIEYINKFGILLASRYQKVV